jgi:DNA-binding CsgD family transcriptional regulator
MKPEELADVDMLALLKLSNHLHELPANPIARHEQMLQALCKLTDAVAGISMLLEAAPRERANVLFLVYHGFEEVREQAKIHSYLRALDVPGETPEPLARLLESRLLESLARREEHNGLEQSIVDARELARSLNLGSTIVSAQPLRPARLISFISLHRSLDATRPFSARHRRLLELFHSQIGWTFRVSQPAEPGAATKLSPRQQQTLGHLLAGASEKQIAAKLSRSQHTVHSYVKAIYRNFGVSSRGELLALFVR